MADFKHYIEG